MVQKLFLLFFFFIWQQAAAQQVVHDILYSNVLKEVRPISISYPPNYQNDGEKYSVIYLLDGNENRESVEAMLNYLQKKRFSILPNLVLVSISNTDRTRDFTPQLVSADHERTSTYENAGGLSNFMDFLKDELRPYIDAKINVSGYNILIGHSFGGLAATHILMQQPSLFNAYVLLDPSLWWDNSQCLPIVENFLNSDACLEKNIFIALANNRVYSTREIVHTDHFDAIYQLGNTILPHSKMPTNQYKFKFYADDDHGTLPIPATYDALKFFFKEIDLPIKDIIKDPSILANCYKNLNKQLHFEIIPNKRTFLDLAKFAQSRKEHENAKTLIDNGLKLYSDDKDLSSALLQP